MVLIYLTISQHPKIWCVCIYVSGGFQETLTEIVSIASKAQTSVLRLIYSQTQTSTHQSALAITMMDL